ncbi:uncharacterized protein VTP21DRAFT_1574 [Calcarisporiella thermophila]|uniref:uncharacterized protein n=1 Tax=Calcarisporiella thermophila TaxID=911321 RepID=UPI003744285F
MDTSQSSYNITAYKRHLFQRAYSYPSPQPSSKSQYYGFSSPAHRDDLGAFDNNTASSERSGEGVNQWIEDEHASHLGREMAGLGKEVTRQFLHLNEARSRTNSPAPPAPPTTIQQPLRIHSLPPEETSTSSTNAEKERP